MHRISPGSDADTDGRICRGDRILAIDNELIDRTWTATTARLALKAAGNQVRRHAVIMQTYSLFMETKSNYCS